ncbi:MAG: YicC/YloC family endoribonuclease [Rikenellaceae bacterium]
MVMQRSMTGYGKGEIVAENKKISVEIRTLNSKQLDLSIKMPGIYRKDELTVRQMLANKVVRGKCDVYISCDSSAVTAGNTINKEIFDSYFNQINALCSPHNIEPKSPQIIEAILRLPDIFSSEKHEASESENQALMAAVEQAAENLDIFRKREGEEMMKDILLRVDNIAALQDDIKKYEGERRITVEQRLKENLENLKVDYDTSRFEQELIYYIEKFDITEEMVRLSSHISHFREVCSSEQMCGKKIGFITQELGREINTTGSKANHMEIQKIVVAMKDELEKIKEQILNIL